MSRAKNIIEGVIHLHTHNIVHRDLAARNVLVNQFFVAKVADLGLSQPSLYGPVHESTKISFRWAAPVRRL